MPEHIKTGGSASGWKARATGPSPAAATGATPSRSGAATPARKTECIGSRAELEKKSGAKVDGPPQALHRRPHVEMLLRRHHEADPRGSGLLVRVRRHALRAEPLPLREQGALRRALPRGLHLGVHRPDAGLVLHPGRPGRRALRQAGLPQRHRQRAHPGRRGQEDVQVGAELHRPHGGHRHLRRGRDAAVPGGLRGAQGGGPALLRGGGEGRGQERHHPAVERVQLLRDLREHRRGHRQRRFPVSLRTPWTAGSSRRRRGWSRR